MIQRTKYRFNITLKNKIALQRTTNNKQNICSTYTIEEQNICSIHYYTKNNIYSTYTSKNKIFPKRKKNETRNIEQL